MSTIRLEDNVIIAGRSVRFSLLSESLVRMEFSPSGEFDDRKSIRVLNRPNPIPFSIVEVDDNGIKLSSQVFTLYYTELDKPFSEKNLRACDRNTQEEFWNPAKVDVQNLGGVHVGMDCIKPGLIPRGVHPATIDHHFNIRKWSWWFYYYYLENAEPGSFEAQLKDMLIDEILAIVDPEKLPKPIKELAEERAKYPPGLLSKAGYFLYNDTPTRRIDTETGWISERSAPEGYQDLYLFYYQKNFAQALKDYQLVFGHTPLIPRYALGLWYSSFPSLSGPQIRDLAYEFAQRELPLDVLVLDLDWHQHGWHGFDWNKEYMGEPVKFFKFLRDENIHLTLNVHPDRIPVEDSHLAKFLNDAEIIYSDQDIIIEQDQEVKKKVRKFIGFDLTIKQHAQAFMDDLHKPIQDHGVAFWWIDGPALVADLPGLDEQLWTNHIYQEYMKQRYPHLRPMVLSRSPGFGASRYPFHFTGDTWSYWETLVNQVEQTLRAGHIGQSFITHDVGGNTSSCLTIDPELYVRWVQFAVLSPIVRLHSGSMEEEPIAGERRPWMYGNRVLIAFEKAIHLRMELIPYLYSLAWESTQNGLPMCRSNCLQNPEWEEGFDEWTSYYLGDRIYAAPIVNPGTMRQVLLPPGKWYRFAWGEEVAREPIQSDGRTKINQIASVWKDYPLHYYKAGTIMVKQPYCLRAGKNPETLILEIYPANEECSDSFILYEDDGMSQDFLRGSYSLLRFDYTEGEEIDVTVHRLVGDFIGCILIRNFEIRVYGSENWMLYYEDKPIQRNYQDQGGICIFRLDALSLNKSHLFKLKRDG